MLRAGLMLLALPLTLQAQSVRDSVVTASVTRTIRLVPDRAVLHIGIEGTGETAKDAVARAETKVAAVREALSRQSAGVEVSAPVPYSVGSTQSLRGYPGAPASPSFMARTVIRLHVTRLSAMPSVVAAALDAGGSHTTTPTFESTGADTARRVVAGEAVAAARREAEAVVAGVGGRLGALIEVTTAGAEQLWPPASYFSLEGGYSGPTAPPDVMVSVTATVKYRMQR